MRSMFRKEQGLDPIGIVGPQRAGKSTILDKVEELHPNHFERLAKYKWRFIGGHWPGANKSKDEIALYSEAEVNELKTTGRVTREGKVVIRDGVAFDYQTRDTLHLVGLTDTLKRDKHRILLSDSHLGAMRFKQYYMLLDGYSREPLTFLFYIDPKTIEARLKTAEIPEPQIRARLQSFEEEFAIFKQNAQEYLFLMSIQSPPIDSSIVLDEAAAAAKKRESRADAERLVSLVEQSRKLYEPGMSYAAIHSKFINSLAQRLFQSNLSDLEERLLDGEVITIDLSGQLDAYLKKYPMRVSNMVRNALKNIEVKNYFHDSANHSILLKGLVDPLDDGPQIAQAEAEDMALNVILFGYAEPTQRRIVRNTDYSKHSDWGMFNVLNGGLVKEGIVYSLGDQLADKVHRLADSVHASLHIGFAYSKEGKPVRLTGYRGDDIQTQKHGEKVGNGLSLLH